MIAKVCAENDIDCGDIAVLTPYSAQVRIVQEELSKRRIPTAAPNGVQVRTVDGYQGNETDFVVVRTTVLDTPTCEFCHGLCAL